MTDLSGKTAIVLGAAGVDNMGNRIARRLASAGAHVVLGGRRPETLDTLAAQIGGMSALCDITRKTDVDALFDAQPRVDIAVNATGWGLLKPLCDTTDEDLDAMVALQFKGVHHMLAAAVRTMTSGGAIVQISSVSTKTLIDDHAAYIGTKAGGEALIRCIANQYGPRIRANTISPGLTESPMTAEAFATPGLIDFLAARYPLARIGTSDDVAEAVLWLCDDKCFLTGQNLQVNGGFTMRGSPAPEDVGLAIQRAIEAMTAARSIVS